MRPRTDLYQNGAYYHVFNRGVDKEYIFTDDLDRERFINAIARFGVDLVSISAFCLMDNHFHFLLEQKQTNGISLFMHKLGTSYTKYFNAKHKRTDSLFGSRYQVVPIQNDEHLLHVSRYIHLNSTALIAKAYRAAGMFSESNVLDFLMKNRWSSFYLYYNDSHDVLTGIFDPASILQAFQDKNDYEKFVLNWLFSKPDNQLGFSQ